MSITLARAQKHVAEQQRRLATTQQRSAWPQFLFHTTHVTNAVNIVRQGFLGARNVVENFHDVANQGALASFDASHDYARLYFRPRNPFHVRTEGIKCVSDLYRFLQNAASVLPQVEDHPLHSFCLELLHGRGGGRPERRECSAELSSGGVAEGDQVPGSQRPNPRKLSAQERRRRNLHNEVLAIATARMRRRLEEELSEDEEFRNLLEQVVERRLDPASAASTLLARGADL